MEEEDRRDLSFGKDDPMDVKIQWWLLPEPINMCHFDGTA